MASSTTSCLLVWALVVAFISQNMVSCSTFQDNKNFYFPPLIPGGGGSPPIDPGVGSPPTDPGVGYPPIDPGAGSPPVIQTPPIVPSPPIGYYTSPPPTHGSPPAHHTPSHGGHHHHGGNPPSNCGNPPSNCGSPPSNCGNPTPKSPPKHVDPSPPHHNPSPAPPTGGYHYNPPSSPTDPSSPPVVLPPTTPDSPPLLPSPPYDPNSPPIGGTCDFWRNHPTIIWGLFGWWGTTIGTAFGTPSALPTTGAHLNLMQALSNTRTDGIGALYREGTASLLNSMVNKSFPYTTDHVKDSFVAALGSNKAAAAQARVFKLANEGHMKLRV